MLAARISTTPLVIFHFFQLQTNVRLTCPRLSDPPPSPYKLYCGGFVGFGLTMSVAGDDSAGDQQVVLGRPMTRRQPDRLGSFTAKAAVQFAEKPSRLESSVPALRSAGTIA